ncbi:MAG: sulfatase [Opitutaceae bacterium]
MKFTPLHFLLFAAALGMPVFGAASAPRPNILFIAVDDLRDWLGYYQRHPQALTPNFDRLAARGVAFTRAYCAAPACNPSRAALMSGLRPSTTGVYNNNQDWRPVVARELTLVSTLKTAGYRTLGAGKIYHGGFDRTAEWDHYEPKGGPDPVTKTEPVGKLRFGPLDCDDDDLRDGRIASYAVRQLGQEHDRPFFLCAGFIKPHLPFSVPRKYFDLHPLENIQLPVVNNGDLADVPEAGKAMAHQNTDHADVLESGRWKEIIQAYLASVSYTDAMLGRVLDALDHSAHRDNTIIVLWSDHGWSLGEKEHWRKFALWEEPTRSPLIWVVPGLTKPRGVSTRAVDLMSIYPTLTSLVGLPTPKHVEGENIRALLANPGATWNRPAITTWGRNNHTVRSNDWRYIRYADGSEELYDAKADPCEWRNLASDPAFAETKAELAKFMPNKNGPNLPTKHGPNGGKGPKNKAGKKSTDN